MDSDPNLGADIHSKNRHSSNYQLESGSESEFESMQCEHVLHDRMTSLGLESESESDWVPESMSGNVNKP